ncbi:hypothetical protein MYCTH_2304576 [Thermothelomyces thermophilus ATCC 42464]|uniref:Uncharacterized protein n=1 Tax=Thermothelomyces thermophilus (strain ATCC 42464 / BCRC 31852 / DSM 1799) TaxID=573729 RepID=G2QBC4_THET4|nr:uncharacterized protein MYCTH_2304576 [Thermothelomyces thermophilus ATCC 42464]AEO57867.1 hypothetical protein MYCTH_2304576 [Thermothelomyces thermophilus ATCC 42464]
MRRVVLENPEDESHRSQHPASEPQGLAETQPARKTRPRQEQSPPPELMEILVPSLKVGAAAGACGVFTGAAAGILRSAPTVFFAIVAGGQWFTLGTSYYATRLSSLRYFGRGKQEPSPSDKIKASTVAGGVAGTFGGMLRGPRNIIPGAIVFSLLGAGGQGIANWRAARVDDAGPKPEKGFWSSWSPIKQLSDADYENILEEKLLRVEADIALIDDRIKELRASESQTKEGKPGHASGGASSSNKA